MHRTDEEARAAIRDVLKTSGLSMRALSAVMGRDADYVAAFLDPRRGTRARPSPEDLLAVADTIGASLVMLLDRVWGIPPERLAEDRAASSGDEAIDLSALTEAERHRVAEYARFVVSSRTGQGGGKKRAAATRKGARQPLTCGARGRIHGTVDKARRPSRVLREEEEEHPAEDRHRGDDQEAENAGGDADGREPRD